jgi:apolipoprotein N-acyltransferase
MNFLNKPLGKLFFALLTGLLFTIAWTPSPFAPLVFIAFVPLLLALDRICEDGGKRKGLRHFGIAYFSLMIWNVGTTWWVYYSSDWGAVAAFVFNTLFMTIVFQLSYLTRKRWGVMIGTISLVVYWIAFEYLHLSWELGWPWLTLGFSIASFPSWMQWYEYTGVLGGSMWILIVNILIFNLIKSAINGKPFYWMKSSFIIIVFIFVPLEISILIYGSISETKSPVNVVIVQPNIDPYNEKFSGNDAEQLDKMLKLAAQQIDTGTDYVAFPETALAEATWEEYLNESPSIQTIKKFIKPYPKLNFVCGMSSQKKYKEGEKLSETARKDNINAKDYYDDYNASFQIDNSGKIQIYHKSKLVPGVEKMPYPKIFGFLGKFAIDLGGTTGSYGTQKERTVFNSVNGKWKVGTAICYESIYGDFLSEYIRNGANLLFIITNDGWWHDTPGYRQHCNYGRLAAIEFRRSIARSANTGTSCFINQKGDIQQATTWWQPAVIKETINANSEMTFYAKHGDYLGVFASIIAVSALLFLFVIMIFNRKKIK